MDICIWGFSGIVYKCLDGEACNDYDENSDFLFWDFSEVVFMNKLKISNQNDVIYLEGYCNYYFDGYFRVGCKQLVDEPYVISDVFYVDVKP